MVRSYYSGGGEHGTRLSLETGGALLGSRGGLTLASEVQIASALAPFVDLLICETMASAAEAASAAAAASASGAASPEGGAYTAHPNWGIDPPLALANAPPAAVVVLCPLFAHSPRVQSQHSFKYE